MKELTDLTECLALLRKLPDAATVCNFCVFGLEAPYSGTYFVQVGLWEYSVRVADAVEQPDEWCDCHNSFRMPKQFLRKSKKINKKQKILLHTSNYGCLQMRGRVKRKKCSLCRGFDLL